MILFEHLSKKALLVVRDTFCTLCQRRATHAGPLGPRYLSQDSLQSLVGDHILMQFKKNMTSTDLSIFLEFLPWGEEGFFILTHESSLLQARRDHFIKK